LLFTCQRSTLIQVRALLGAREGVSIRLGLVGVKGKIRGLLN
jgi:hypothetical protein